MGWRGGRPRALAAAEAEGDQAPSRSSPRRRGIPVAREQHARTPRFGRPSRRQPGCDANARRRPAPWSAAGRGSATGNACASVRGFSKRLGPRHRPAGPQRPDDREGLLEAGGALRRLGELDAVRPMLGRAAAYPDAHREPAAARELKGRSHAGEQRRVAVHHVRDERPQTDRLRRAGGHGEHRPLLHHRNALVTLADDVVPRPDRPVARGFEANRALEPPLRRGPDRPDRDADGKPLARGTAPSEERCLAGDVCPSRASAHRLPRAERVEVGRNRR